MIIPNHDIFHLKIVKIVIQLNVFLFIYLFTYLLICMTFILILMESFTKLTNTILTLLSKVVATSIQSAVGR